MPVFPPPMAIIVDGDILLLVLFVVLGIGRGGELGVANCIFVSEWRRPVVGGGVVLLALLWSEGTGEAEPVGAGSGEEVDSSG